MGTAQMHLEGGKLLFTNSRFEYTNDSHLEADAV